MLTQRVPRADVLILKNRSTDDSVALVRERFPDMRLLALSRTLGTYYLVACADDTTTVTESNETNNCRASAATVQVTRPDLIETGLGDPPAAAARGSSFFVTETVVNQSVVAADASTTRYYLSTDGVAKTKRLNGTRTIGPLGPGAPSPAPPTNSVSVPNNTVLGTYYLLACADDTTSVTESDETNNCQASATRVVVGP